MRLFSKLSVCESLTRTKVQIFELRCYVSNLSLDWCNVLPMEGNSNSRQAKWRGIAHCSGSIKSSRLLPNHVVFSRKMPEEDQRGLTPLRQTFQSDWILRGRGHEMKVELWDDLLVCLISNLAFVHFYLPSVDRTTKKQKLRLCHFVCDSH